MQVRDWQDILQELIAQESDPQNWRAISGVRSEGIGEDLYLCHPRGGLYHLKTYAKNPFKIQGFGAKLARKIDDEIESHFPVDVGGRFAIQKPFTEEVEIKRATKKIEETIRVHSEAPTNPLDLFEDVMVAMKSPAYGPLDYRGIGNRPESLDILAMEFHDLNKKLERKLEGTIRDDEIGRGFG